MVSLRPGESLHLRLEAMLLWGRILVASGEYHHAEGLLQDTAQRAESAGLCVIEGHANALLGQVDCFLGRIDQGDARMANSVDVLVQRGRHSAALDASLVWARARGVTLNPDAIFEPVSALLEQSVALVPRLERLIALRGYRGGSRDVDSKIQEILDQIISNSSGMERSALRVHPWSRVIRTR